MCLVFSFSFRPVVRFNLALLQCHLDLKFLSKQGWTILRRKHYCYLVVKSMLKRGGAILLLFLGQGECL